MTLLCRRCFGTRGAVAASGRGAQLPSVASTLYTGAALRSQSSAGRRPGDMSPGSTRSTLLTKPESWSLSQ